LSSTFYNKKSTCGCSDIPNTNFRQKNFVPDCYAVDLGEIYNNFPDYSNGPCSPCSQGGDPETFTNPPHGRIKNLTTACSKLVIFKGARVIYEEFTYEGNPLILFSRSRTSLPRLNAFTFVRCTILNPLHCPAENGLRDVECCKTCTTTSGDPPTTRTDTKCNLYGGPYLNVEHDEIPTNAAGCTGCERIELVLLPEWREQELGFGFSPCLFESMSTCSGGNEDPIICEDEGSANLRILAGYAIDNNPTWLLDEEKSVFPIVKNAIIENDPLGAFPHTVYAHFELNTEYIKCCGTSTLVGFTDKETREEAVNVQVALGFSCQLCGIDPEKACVEIYEE
jgi:hypothetical protein